jgi:hypothetical protein
MHKSGNLQIQRVDGDHNSFVRGLGNYEHACRLAALKFYLQVSSLFHQIAFLNLSLQD